MNYSLIAIFCFVFFSSPNKKKQFLVVNWRCAFVPLIRDRVQNAVKSIVRPIHCAHIWRISTPFAQDIVVFCVEPLPSRVIHCIRICHDNIVEFQPRICPFCQCQAHLIQNSLHVCWLKPALRFHLKNYEPVLHRPVEHVAATWNLNHEAWTIRTVTLTKWKIRKIWQWPVASITITWAAAMIQWWVSHIRIQQLHESVRLAVNQIKIKKICHTVLLVRQFWIHTCNSSQKALSVSSEKETIIISTFLFVSFEKTKSNKHWTLFIN